MTRPVAPLALELEGGDLPAFLAIARAVADGARSGRIAPGTRLPGSRELARSLGVHRNTVLAAYRELAAEGFLDSAQGRGTFVAATLPEVKPRRWASPGAAPALAERPPYSFHAVEPVVPFVAPRPGTLLLYGGVPDTRTLPRDALARAYRRALRASPHLLDYGDPRGEPRLRAALAEMLRTARGLPVGPDDVVVTRGSQMALSLIGRALVRPGDVVAVEALGYQPAWRALAQPGARLVPVPVDREGLVVDALDALAEREPVRAVYVTPHHQYPTTVTMSAGRRMALLELARRRRFAIVEDDYDHEFHYEGRPVLPLASNDPAGTVLYVGTLSKVLAPGLRAGYLVAPPQIRDTIVALRFETDRQGDRLGEHALAELMEDGELGRHFWRMRRIYEARRDHCVALLRARLGEVLDVHVPPGGMSLWAKVAPSVPVDAFHREAEQRGVAFQPGRLFTWGAVDTQHVRLGYGALTEEEMTRAVQLLVDAARAATDPLSSRARRSTPGSRTSRAPRSRARRG